MQASADRAARCGVCHRLCGHIVPHPASHYTARPSFATMDRRERDRASANDCTWCGHAADRTGKGAATRRHWCGSGCRDVLGHDLPQRGLPQLVLTHPSARDRVAAPRLAAPERLCQKLRRLSEVVLRQLERRNGTHLRHGVRARGLRYPKQPASRKKSRFRQAESSEMGGPSSTLLAAVFCQLSQGFQAVPTLLPAARMAAPPIISNRIPRLALRGDGPAPGSMVQRMNAATKWLVTFAQTVPVVMRRDLVSPYIIIGAIASAFSCGKLKAAIGQKRPPGSPFSDPGMPSSHALVSTFAAAAWALYLRRTLTTVCLLTASATVSVLRVVCGYHTVPQIAVGAALGGLGACGWMSIGAAVGSRCNPQLAYRLVYTSYFLGSALFVGKKMSKWAAKEV